ncbi:hypothetical protein EYF80_015473 [Liparis tanakae]|uniref:Uncharacterized protein n=1 Tax=Liparis tanakae TaxID=230148 RepID=A0A4Z2I8M8_9TELE|nr:hypothetical protein EYF80_015473 [Liparis tanakae]
MQRQALDKEASLWDSNEAERRGSRASAGWRGWAVAAVVVGSLKSLTAEVSLFQPGSVSYWTSTCCNTS